MTAGCRRPVLVVEGDGDKLAVPELVRLVAAELDLHDFVPAPRPIKAGDVRKLQQEGNLEKWIRYALARPDGDSVPLVVDCDDECPCEVAKQFSARMAGVVGSYSRKRIAMGLIKKEFESLFLASLDSIVQRYPDYGWRNADFFGGPENVRACKERLSRMMEGGRSYKETRDQVKFVTARDWHRLRVTSRSFLHLERMLLWLSNAEKQGQVYPAF